MDARLQRRVQRYGWDRAAAHYERAWWRQLAPAQERLLALAMLSPGERVLDVACGTGLVTFPAAAAVGTTGEVVGTDISDRMVEAARAEAARRELHRVLRPGGRAIASVWGARAHCGWAEIFPIVDRRVQSEVCPMFFQLGTGEALARAFEAAGFTDLRSERLSTSLHYDSAEDACQAAFAGGPVALAYSRFDDATREDAHREYLASVEPYRNGTGYEVPGEFVVTLGRKN